MCQQLAFVTASHMYQAECAEKVKHVAEEHKGVPWAQMNAHNMKLARHILRKGYVIERRPSHWRVVSTSRVLAHRTGAAE